MAAVSAKAISYTFDTGEGARPVLHDVDLAVDPGEFVILTGPSGSGKTTLLSLVGALRRPQQGELTVLGRDVAALRGRDLEAFRRRIGFVFQLHNLFPALTASESVQMALDLVDVPDEERAPRVAGILERLGLGEG